MNLLDTFICDLTASLLTHLERQPDSPNENKGLGLTCSNNLSVSLHLALHLHERHLSGVRGVVRKHHARLRLGDLSFPLALQQWRRMAVSSAKRADEQALLQHLMDWELGNACPWSGRAGADSGCCLLTRRMAQQGFSHDCQAEKLVEWLVASSASWPLPVQSLVRREDRVVVFLERASATRSVLQQVQEMGADYGRIPGTGKVAYLTADVAPGTAQLDLSSLRLRLLQMHLQRLLQAAGFQVLLEEPPALQDNCVPQGSQKTPLHLHLTTRSSSLPPDATQLLVGVVTSKEHQCKEPMTAEEYYSLRLEDTRAAARHKTDSMSEWGSCLSSLADAAVKVDLLGVRLGGLLVLDVRGQQRPGRAAGTKGAAFILYNFARVAAIMARFQESVDAGTCPELPLLADLDLSLLSKEEEWELVFDYLLPFPQLLRSCTEGAEEGKVLTHSLCQFLTAFGSAISSYYSKTRILVEPRSHLLPALFARLHLLRAVHQVLANALHLLDISAVRQM